MKILRLRTVMAALGAVCLLAGCGGQDIVQDIGQDTETFILDIGQDINEWIGASGSVTNDNGSIASTQDGEKEEEEESVLFREPDTYCYAYDTLSETQKIWYRDIDAVLGNMQKERELAPEGFKEGLNEEDIDRIFQCVLNDHPEYFYVEGYTYTKYTQMDKLVKLVFSGTYSVSLQEAERRHSQIVLAVEQLLAGVPEEASDYDKVKYVYETLIRETEYDLSAPDNQNIYSVFVNHASVCQGYAKATQYLLNKLGIDCTLVLGTVDTGEGHAWNLVKVDGEYYYVDTTWGDASYQTEGEGAFMMPEINYDYLCVTTGQISRTHTLGDEEPMPECDALEANYYIKEGAYFDSFDEEQLKGFFEEAQEQGRSDVTLKCGNEEVYGEFKRRLLEEQEIFDYFKHDGKIAYAQNVKQLSLTFWVTNE